MLRVLCVTGASPVTKINIIGLIRSREVRVTLDRRRSADLEFRSCVITDQKVRRPTYPANKERTNSNKLTAAAGRRDRKSERMCVNIDQDNGSRFAYQDFFRHPFLEQSVPRKLVSNNFYPSLSVRGLESFLHLTLFKYALGTGRKKGVAMAAAAA